MVRIRKVPQTGLRVQATMESPQRTLIQSQDRPQSVQSMRLDMPEILGGSDKGLMPLEALIGAYAGSLNVVGNFVAKTMDFELQDWNFTVWAEFDPRGIYGLTKVPKALRVIHVDAKVSTPESPQRLKQLHKTTTERCPVHNLLKSAGVRFKENWQIVSADGAKTSAAAGAARSKSKKK